MPSTLSAHEKRILQIFSDEFAFTIPGYQRPYAWTTVQAGDLIDDLTSFMRATPGSVEEMPPYFLGSIVLIKGDESPKADVVDGQQRLTTLTLLLAALRSNLEPELGSGLTTLIYQAGHPLLGLKDQFRLLPRERDRPFFQDFVQKTGGFEQLIALDEELPDSRQRLRDNARLFQSRLGEMKEEERARLAQFVATRCFLVAVATPDLDAAYRIFSVMNSRGLDLAATDILKAEIIGSIPEHDREAYTAQWEDIEEDLGRESFNDLFSHIRMIYRKAKPQGTLLREFQQHVSSAYPPIKLINEVIAPYAKIFGELVGEAYTSAHDAAAVNRSLKWLNRLEFSDWLPPALAFSVRFRSNGPAMTQFFADVERLAYFMLVTKMGINDRIERFSRLAAEIESGGVLHDDKSALQLAEPERATMLEALDGPVYESLQARARSTLMLRLDDLVSGGGATYEYATVTVEHVLPQTPSSGSQWLEWFPDAVARAAWTHRLGNLAILTRKKNSSASNYEFDRKKAAYFTVGGVSPFPLTTQVLAHESWTPDLIAARQKQLIGRLSEHWRLE